MILSLVAKPHDVIGVPSVHSTVKKLYIARYLDVILRSVAKPDFADSLPYGVDIG